MKKSLLLLFAISITAFFTACHKPFYIQSYQEQNYKIEATNAPQDSNVLALIKPYKQGVDTQMTVVIGHSDIPLSKAQPESTLGNFIADAQLATAKKIDPKVEVSIMNYGGIRLPYIAPGPLPKASFTSLCPLII